MTAPGLTASAALAALDVTADGAPIGPTSGFVCPYPDCRLFAVHHWGTAESLTVQLGRNSSTQRMVGSTLIVCSRCEACTQEIVFVDGRMVQPEVSEAPAPANDLPAELADDYEEAQRVLPVSPRGSAALLRLLVQKLLPLIGAQQDDINKMIGELVQKGTISKAIQQALDSVRVIGNEAVHPGTMDLKDDRQTAASLFNLINFIVEKAITEPKEVDAIFAGLPSGKLAGIVNRDKPKP